MAIKQAQNSMWKALKSELTFDISMEETHGILEMYAGSKVTLARTRNVICIYMINHHSG